MTGYVFEHAGAQFSPDGRVSVEDVAAHNRALEAAELDAWAQKPAHGLGYIGDKSEAAGLVTTWLGTTIGRIIRSNRYVDGFGHRMRSVRVRGTNGVEYHGRYGYDWSQAVRLHACKREG